MTIKRKAFNFYNSHWLQIKLLNDKQKLELYNAICQVQFLEINIEDIKFDDPMSNIVWTGIKHSIQTSLNGFITKQIGLGKDILTPLSKGIENPTQAPYIDPCQQEKGKEKEEEEEEEEGKEENKKVFNFRKELLNLGIENNIIDDWLKVRKTKKATNTETAFNSIKKQIELCSLNANDCIKLAVEKSWSGFKSEWAENAKGTPTRKKTVYDINEDMANNPNRMSFD